jgi:alanine-glyoxylate transaminase / serine-glyoxylate transaminase / serine-pyruvate transaminase
MDTYEKGGFGYHTTMPTDALRDFHEISVETLKFGLPQLKEAQLELGRQARNVVNSKGLISVAAPGFQAPGVLVYYSPDKTDNPVMMVRTVHVSNA